MDISLARYDLTRNPNIVAACPCTSVPRPALFAKRGFSRPGARRKRLSYEQRSMEAIDESPRTMIDGRRKKPAMKRTVDRSDWRTIAQAIALIARLLPANS
ncbi:MAG TPA: hypothetical protein VL126_09665 [Bacteroidota bacterium]|nr:hypothetical protein [Bacteroidota bacterium]